MPAPITLKRKVGIIDLGSNSARLLVAHYQPGEAYRFTHEFSRRVRLSEGQAAGGALRAPAILRAAQAIRQFKAFCDGHGIRRIVPVATAAVRDAANRTQFLAQLHSATGLKFRVLDGEEEAYFGVLGVVNSLGLRDGLVMDVGGGSTELSRVRRGRFRRGATTPLGAVRLTEMFFGPAGAATASAVERLETYVADTLQRCNWLALKTGEDFVGVGGTVRALARIDREARAYPLALINGYVLEGDRLAAILARLVELPVSQRVRALPGLPADRADIILAGALVVQGALRHAQAQRLVVCAHGLREGLFFREFLRPKNPPVIHNLREFSVLNLARLFGGEAGHVQHVAKLALALFDQLAGVHGCGPSERDCLWAAAILHDIGASVNYHDPHPHSAYVILNAGLPGYSHAETALIALLCQSHRQGRSDQSQLPAPSQPCDAARVDRLAALLRLADCLDGCRTGSLTRLHVERDGRTVRLRAIARRGADPRADISEAQRSAGLFEAAFDCKLDITQG